MNQVRIWTAEEKQKVERAWIVDGELVREKPVQPCRVLETENGAITPGLVETVSSLGLVEVGLESTTADTDAHGRDSHEGAPPDFPGGTRD